MAPQIYDPEIDCLRDITQPEVDKLMIQAPAFVKMKAIAESVWEHKHGSPERAQAALDAIQNIIFIAREAAKSARIPIELRVARVAAYEKNYGSSAAAAWMCGQAANG